jgi:hypothetical protein
MTAIPYDFEVVRQVYPQVASMCSENGAWDEDGNEVEIDFSLLDPLVAAHEVAMQWRWMRAERDARLSETDWYVAADRTASAEQLAYRQALRDLPANTVDPANPVWPTKP